MEFCDEPLVKEFDVIVVGAGSAGLASAAGAAAQAAFFRLKKESVGNIPPARSGRPRE